MLGSDSRFLSKRLGSLLQTDRMKAGTLYNSNLHQEQIPQKLNVLREGIQRDTGATHWGGAYNLTEK